MESHQSPVWIHAMGFHRSIHLMSGCLWTVLSALAWGQLARPAIGQQVLIRQVAPIEAKVAQDDPELPQNVFAGNETGGKGGSDGDSAQTIRLNKLRQMQVDRRPSAVLQAWANASDGSREEAALEASRESGTKKPATAPDPLDQQIKECERGITLGDWALVGRFLRSLPDEESQAAYARILQALASNMAVMPGGASLTGPDGEPSIARSAENPQLQQFAEKHMISTQDVIHLIQIRPGKLDDKRIALLGRLLAASLSRGNDLEDFLTRVRSLLPPAADPAILTEREAARLVMESGEAIRAGVFLPTVEEAIHRDDYEGLNLLARHHLGLYQKEQKLSDLEQAWKASLAVLAASGVDRKQSKEALQRAVELAPRVDVSLGRKWLEQSFTEEPQRGMEILAGIGGAASRGLTTHPMQPETRRKTLELQKSAVGALLEKAPERAREWQSRLDLLAAAWLAEAEFSQRYDTSTMMGPMMRRDMYGNLFFVNEDGMMQNPIQQNPNIPRAISVAQILETRPDDAWISRLDPGMQPRYADILARLYLKVGEESEAFPYIEQLAQAHPDLAKKLASEFLRVWTRNHDPNDQRNQTNPYMFMFGFDRKAESIPLTRSKQERNLRELAGYMERLRKLPIPKLDEQLLSRAFTACHSSAEVYRTEAFEQVFGSLDQVEPETLAALIQQMRGNLAGLWRQPAVQEQQKTKRREQDIKAEVVRGYEVARSVIERALRDRPAEWSLRLAQAAILHDENDYLQELNPSTDYAARRKEALAAFAGAAALYALKVPDLTADEETTEVFDQWFAAGLGACDLNRIDEKKQADPHQPALIRKALESLPGEAAKRHLDRFANALFTRMSALNPAVKFRYLQSGFAIIGDREQAREARKVYDYYKDLVTELKLDALLDGSDVIGHDQPFGLLVQLRHTREIERESGGFGRYLQNQNAGGMAFYYNYGRPLENYRDKFEQAAREALKETFEVLSVTFQDEKVNSRATSEYGWRTTPYAYLLLKARSPKVDRIPPLRLDLDFLDTSGYVILPIESPPVPVDARAEAPPPRPARKLQIIQTLDERQAKQGRLILEVKATAQGLVPSLNQLLTIDVPGFRVTGSEDQGLSVARFDPDSVDPVVQSERLWLVNLVATTEHAKMPRQFRFPAPLAEDAEVTHQRYVDADLESVGPTIPLAESYGRVDHSWLIGAGLGLIGLLLAGIFGWRWFWSRPRAVASERFLMPEVITPFTVLGLLRDIERNNGLSPAAKKDLAAQIEQIERRYFAEDTTTPEPDLRAIAEHWLHSRV
jgi:hypothetical protein